MLPRFFFYLGGQFSLVVAAASICKCPFFCHLPLDYKSFMMAFALQLWLLLHLLATAP